jgi:hypothetical protein
MTPRPGADPTGLPTFDNPSYFESGTKLQVIDTSLLKLVQAFPDAPPEGHVSLAPADSSLIEEWAATRGTPEAESNSLTKDIINAIIDTIRAP